MPTDNDGISLTNVNKLNKMFSKLGEVHAILTSINVATDLSSQELDNVRVLLEAITISLQIRGMREYDNDR